MYTKYQQGGPGGQLASIYQALVQAGMIQMPFEQFQQLPQEQIQQLIMQAQAKMQEAQGAPQPPQMQNGGDTDDDDDDDDIMDDIIDDGLSGLSNLDDNDNNNYDPTGAQLAGTALGAVGSLMIDEDKPDKAPTAIGSSLSKAGQMAATFAPLGPAGAIIGGIAGAGLGLYDALEESKEYKKGLKEKAKARQIGDLGTSYNPLAAMGGKYSTLDAEKAEANRVANLSQSDFKRYTGGKMPNNMKGIGRAGIDKMQSGSTAYPMGAGTMGWGSPGYSGAPGYTNEQYRNMQLARESMESTFPSIYRDAVMGINEAEARMANPEGAYPRDTYMGTDKQRLYKNNPYLYDILHDERWKKIYENRLDWLKGVDSKRGLNQLPKPRPKAHVVPKSEWKYLKTITPNYYANGGAMVPTYADAWRNRNFSQPVNMDSYGTTSHITANSTSPYQMGGYYDPMGEAIDRLESYGPNMMMNGGMVPGMINNRTSPRWLQQGGNIYRSAAIAPEQTGMRPSLNFVPPPTASYNVNPLWNREAGYDLLINPTLGTKEVPTMQKMINQHSNYMDEYGYLLDDDDYLGRLQYEKGMRDALKEKQRYERAYDNYAKGKKKSRKFRQQGGFTIDNAQPIPVPLSWMNESMDKTSKRRKRRKGGFVNFRNGGPAEVLQDGGEADVEIEGGEAVVSQNGRAEDTTLFGGAEAKNASPIGYMAQGAKHGEKNAAGSEGIPMSVEDPDGVYIASKKLGLDGRNASSKNPAVADLMEPYLKYAEEVTESKDKMANNPQALQAIKKELEKLEEEAELGKALTEIEKIAKSRNKDNIKETHSALFQFLNTAYPAQNDVQSMQGNLPSPEQMIQMSNQGTQPGPQDMMEQEVAEGPNPMMSPDNPMMNDQMAAPQEEMPQEGMLMAKGGKWIQKATKSIKEKGTEGVCSGENFGGPQCPPGSKRYNLAKTFREMANRRKKRALGGYTRLHGDDNHDDVYVGDTYIGGYAHPDLVLGYGGMANNTMGMGGYSDMMGMGGYADMEKGGGLPKWLFEARGRAMRKNMMGGGRMTYATMGMGGYPKLQYAGNTTAVQRSWNKFSDPMEKFYNTQGMLAPLKRQGAKLLQKQAQDLFSRSDFADMTDPQLDRIYAAKKGGVEEDYYRRMPFENKEPFRKAYVESRNRRQAEEKARRQMENQTVGTIMSNLMEAQTPTVSEYPEYFNTGDVKSDYQKAYIRGKGPGHGNLPPRYGQGGMMYGYGGSLPKAQRGLSGKALDDWILAVQKQKFLDRELKTKGVRTPSGAVDITPVMQYIEDEESRLEAMPGIENAPENLHVLTKDYSPEFYTKVNRYGIYDVAGQRRPGTFLKPRDVAHNYNFVSFDNEKFPIEDFYDELNTWDTSSPEAYKKYVEFANRPLMSTPKKGSPKKGRGGNLMYGYGGRPMYGYGSRYPMAQGGGLKDGDYVEFEHGGKMVKGMVTNYDPMTGDFMIS